MPEHQRLSELEQQGGELTIGGYKLTDLLGRAGQTPFFAYDRRAIQARIADCKRSLPADVLLSYAIKANPMPALVGFMGDLVDGFDVASHSELLVALNAGADPSKISLAGPGKSEATLRAAIASGATISVESQNELERCITLGQEQQKVPQISFRLNPDFQLKMSGMKMTGLASQFGIDVSAVGQVIETARTGACRVVGLQIFSGSQNLNAGAIIESNEQTISLALDIIQTENLELEFVNIGGGLGIPYFPNDRAIDIAEIGDALNDTMDGFRKQCKDTKIKVELGRFLVGEAGYYVSQVIDVKESKGERFAVLDGGMHHHLANSGNLGQVIRRNYPVVVGNKLGKPDNEKINIVGPLCTPLDIVAQGITVPEIEVGDLVVVLQSGAYAYSASPTAFLGHPAAEEILI